MHAEGDVGGGRIGASHMRGLTCRPVGVCNHRGRSYRAALAPCSMQPSSSPRAFPPSSVHLADLCGHWRIDNPPILPMGTIRISSSQGREFLDQQKRGKMVGGWRMRRRGVPAALAPSTRRLTFPPDQVLSVSMTRDSRPSVQRASRCRWYFAGEKLCRVLRMKLDGNRAFYLGNCQCVCDISFQRPQGDRPSFLVFR